MLDLKFILKNREIIEKNCRLRNVQVNLGLIEELSRRRSELLQEIEKIRHEINKITEQVKIESVETERKKLIEKGQTFKKELKEKEKELKKIEVSLKEESLKIPNLTHPKAPIGFTDQDNVEVKRVGEIRNFTFKPRDHLQLGILLDIFDFEGGARTTGNKFYFLKNEGLLLELALVQYTLEILAKEGFQLLLTPDLARLDVIEGIGYIPRGPETQIYKIENQNLGLIATAEITLGGLFWNKIIEESELPIKLGGLSHCFRREAGTYGKASKGLYRVHQFTKVEMFIFSLPEESEKMLNYIVDIEIKIFNGLGIPIRVVDCCTGDLGGAAYRKFDLEAWMPGENKWGEVTSASNCTDYQARRLNIKFKRSNSQKTEFVHTLNGTGIAVSRALVALLENFQEPDGSVIIPKPLQKWIGKEKLTPKEIK
jgi:seryl-tRNA synthetase